MINILNLTSETVTLFKKCFDSNGIPKVIKNIEWQFFKNTETNFFVNIAFDEKKNKTAGIYAVSCVRFKIENTIIGGAQSLDTITDIDYRGQGLFIKLAKSVYSKAKNAGMALVYGFPNGNSIYGFEKKLDWTVLDPLPFLIKPLKSKYFTNRIKVLHFLPDINLSYSKYRKDKNYILNKNNYFPDEVNDIWNVFSEKFAVAVVRDKLYLEWRYIEKPNEDYKVVHCWSKEKEYLGFIIYTIKEKHGGNIAYIMELMYDLKRPKAGEILLQYAINEIKKKNADCILSWCLEHSPNFRIYKRSRFFKMPEKIRPIELHFGVHVFKKTMKTIINNRKNWYISYSDSDTV